MSHHSSGGVFSRLALRLNRFPQGAPPSKLLYRILAILFSEKEAALVERLPLRPFTPRRAARIWRLPLARASAILESLAERALLLDFDHDGRTLYVLPPPMAGFFEFSLMRLRTDIDQRTLSRLFYRYINQEEEFIRALFAGGETQLGRVLVHEPALGPKQAAAVLDYERASEVIRTARHIAVGLCYCRQKMRHVGKGCAFPPDNCMTLNRVAEPLIRRGIARSIDAAEGLDTLQRAWESNLVQCADNVREGVNFICHCCACCCEGLIAARRLAIPRPLYTTNFLPRVDAAACNGCGRCSPACPIGVLALLPKPAAEGPARLQPSPDEELCLGCGICVRACLHRAIRLEPRKQRVLTPANTAHRVVLMAIERGTLQNLIFDGQGGGHRVLTAILGAILKLSPLKALLATKQLKSRYLERLLEGRELF